MEIKTENSAVGNATEHLSDPYNAANLLFYHTSLAMVERLVNVGVLTMDDYRKSCRILTKKYGLPLDSIFAETA